MTELLNIDRWLLGLLNGSDSLFLDSVATKLTAGMTWVPLYFALLYLVVKEDASRLLVHLQPAQILCFLMNLQVIWTV